MFAAFWIVFTFGAAFAEVVAGFPWSMAILAGYVLICIALVAMLGRDG